MNKLTLIKSDTSHDLAHLYEHVFFIHADTILRAEGLFAPLDYTLDAYTTDGRITVTCKLYNQLLNSERLFSSLRQLSIDFELEITQIAVRQLECEYGRELLVPSIENLYTALESLHEQPWQDTGVPNNLAHDGIIEKGEVINTKTIHTFIPLGAAGTELSPLTRQVAGLIVNTFVSDTADTYGGFVDSQAYQVTNGVLEGIVVLHESDDVSEDTLAALFQETLDEIIQNNGFERLVEMLRNIETTLQPPSSKYTLRDTGVQVSAEKWRIISTETNLNNVIDAIKNNTSFS